MQNDGEAPLWGSFAGPDIWKRAMLKTPLDALSVEATCFRLESRHNSLFSNLQFGNLFHVPSDANIFSCHSVDFRKRDPAASDKVLGFDHGNLKRWNFGFDDVVKFSQCNFIDNSFLFL